MGWLGVEVSQGLRVPTRRVGPTGVPRNHGEPLLDGGVYDGGE